MSTFLLVQYRQNTQAQKKKQIKSFKRTNTEETISVSLSCSCQHNLSLSVVPGFEFSVFKLARGEPVTIIYTFCLLGSSMNSFLVSFL